ncbi:hypothetical protein FRZ67_01525 [Panacibacter ginsenosidivorans]|uniref:BcpO-related WXXGXW repeat protein n=1 Tax=Panacibacter ginsenosidivorans TaxID=1813871 RepID=A0A5B8V3E9_9BACT|nr:DUF6600 domain-containing protein [Panacibacter ginsenosidivorans]QEC66047.1 hypothetical protein FRZ67_01525 [Panacibacter ginsenosidivorans]
MKAKFNNSLFTVLSMTVLMSCSTSRSATAQYPDDNDRYDNYQDDDSYNDDDNDYYDEPSESDVNINVFVNELSPYGHWINSPSYGQVWIPYETGFTPYYTRGHWVYSNYGWTWASDYRWGWAPFHYGRWANDPFYGWMWVPGYQWGPAWVGWRTGGDYYGWAPLAPGINISIGFGFGNYMPANNWCFVPRRYIGYNNFNRYAVNRSRNVTIIRNTTIINNTNIYRNTRYVTGPSRMEVERYTGRRVNELRVSNSARPGATRITNNNTVNIYRPQVNRNPAIRNDNRNSRIDANGNGLPSHNNNTPNQNPRVIRTPERRTDNNNNNDNRKPDPRDRVNDNRNNNHVDINRDMTNDINRNRDNNSNRNNNQRRDNDITTRPPQQNDNRYPDNRNYNNRNNDQQNRQNNQRPPSDFNRNQQPQNRSLDQNRNNGQRPDYNNNRSNGHSWQPSQQQPQRNAPARPAPPQQRDSRRRPA